MAKRTPAFERVHVNIELLGVYFPTLSSRPLLFDVEAWENSSDESKRAFDPKPFIQEPRKRCGARLENTFDGLKRLRKDLEEGECSPASFIVRHLEHIDRRDADRRQLGMARLVHKHMKLLLTTADEPLRSELIADGWMTIEQDRKDALMRDTFQLSTPANAATDP